MRTSVAKVERRCFGKGIRIVRGKNRGGSRWIPSKSSFALDQRNERSNCGILGESGAEWQMAATSLHDDVLLDSEEWHELEANRAYADVDSLV